jgi:DNA gyrase subunit A
MEIGLVQQIDIDVEMQQSYLDYAMSVIISRALPDARDGFKPVHRRILHSMYSMGIRPDSPYRKSARIVGEVLGKYHPHGDMAVYDAMARMAQPFSMRYLLVDGQGNFGSVDGDPPAAMRYTEAKLSELTMEIMADLEKDTVAFADNFDGSLREPTVLPCGIPNLLANGATGIAVGMSTSIPPHNMGELCDALIYMLDHWKRIDEINIEEIMGMIPGPDFPTGGIILRGEGDQDSIASAYATGRGKITLQARTHIEEMGRGRSRIIVTELPYQVNKSNLIERIADIARAGGLEGLADLRDESDREGMRIVLELTKTADPEHILASLYRRTPMQMTFSVIMLALVEGEPRMLTLKQSLRVFLDHRLLVVKRRSEYDLARAREREHILAGLRVALQNLDEVIQMIRSSKDAEQASTRLQKRLKLSEPQARAILDMPLRRLASLERRKIETEYKEILARIQELESLLRSSKKMRGLVAEELAGVKNRYGDRRRTQIAHAKKGKKTTVLTATDLAPDKDTWVVISKDGQILRTPTGRLPRLSGTDAPALVIGANTRDAIYIFDDRGNGAAINAHTIPESDDPTKGRHFTGLSPFDVNAELVTGIAIPHELVSEGREAYILFATKRGVVKKTEITALPGPSSKTFEAMKVASDDALGWVALLNGEEDILLINSEGMAIRFPEDAVRAMGLSAAGVMGIRMGDEAEVIAMAVVEEGKELLLLTSDGQAKRTAFKNFPVQGRHGKGVLAWKSGESFQLAGGGAGDEKERGMARFRLGAPRPIRFGDAPRRARTSAGKLLFEVNPKNPIIAFTLAGSRALPKRFNDRPAEADPRAGEAPPDPAPGKPVPTAEAGEGETGRKTSAGKKASTGKSAAAKRSPAKKGSAKKSSAGRQTPPGAKAAGKEAKS